jgi:hypothetical protein
MIKAYAIFSLVVTFLLLFPISKKEQLLLLSQKYFPENYQVLKEYDESQINSMAHGDSIKNFISDVSTIVHEGFHHYQGLHSSYYDSLVLYRINDTLSFAVHNFKTFPVNKINSIVPIETRKKIFRYEIYVNAKDKFNVTQQFGILGLLEETVAYYHSFGTDLALFNFYKDNYGWGDPGPWLTWLGSIASYRYAFAEFELFISWYMQYAKSNYPVIYSDIINNPGLKKLFNFMEKENARLTFLYNQCRETILSQFKGRLKVDGNYMYDMQNHSGKGLYDDELAAMNNLLTLPPHQILTELKK